MSIVTQPTSYELFRTRVRLQLKLITSAQLSEPHSTYHGPPSNAKEKNKHSGRTIKYCMNINALKCLWFTKNTDNLVFPSSVSSCILGYSFIHSFFNCLSWGIDGGGGNPTEIMIIMNVAYFVHACAVYSVSQPQQSQQHTTLVI